MMAQVDNLDVLVTRGFLKTAGCRDTKSTYTSLMLGFAGHKNMIATSRD